MCQGFLTEYLELSKRIDQVANGAPSVAANLDCHLTPHRRATDLAFSELTPSCKNPMNYETTALLKEIERLKTENAATPLRTEQAESSALHGIRAALQTEQEARCALTDENLELQRKIQALEAGPLPDERLTAENLELRLKIQALQARLRRSPWLKCCFRAEAQTELFEVPPATTRPQ
jgi:hypothetical protein